MDLPPIPKNKNTTAYRQKWKAISKAKHNQRQLSHEIREKPTGPIYPIKKIL